MKKDELIKLLEYFTIKYNNGLDYIRNNPNLSREEVVEHYKNLKDMRTIQNQLKEYN